MEDGLGRGFGNFKASVCHRRATIAARRRKNIGEKMKLERYIESKRG